MDNTAEVDEDYMCCRNDGGSICDGMQEYTYSTCKQLSQEEISLLEKQNSRLVSEFKSSKVESETRKHWDLFYKRNENRFFKDRHWTTREFLELLGEGEGKRLLETGCGVGNLIYPLLKETKWYFYACDLSPRAVSLLRGNPLYDERRICALELDLSAGCCFDDTPVRDVDVATMVFVLSAVHPDKFKTVLLNIRGCLKPGGILLFRDYGRYDMAQLRFKPGHKISDNFYLRQDGTRSYFFSVEEFESLAASCGFNVITNCYVHRRTVNVKESIDVPRIFIQAKLMKSPN